MKKIDLITGFLGSGKTSFIKKYARYLIKQGFKVGILINDYGAVNVDMMLLQDLQKEGCELEMVAGGCDAECHRRRFKTKLIAMGMSDYDRVLIEPSGIFDVDEFFDAVYEEPLCKWYEIGNVITIVDANIEEELSEQSEFIFASMLANAGMVLLSKTECVQKDKISQTIAHINKSMEKIKCKRRFEHEILIKDWNNLNDSDYERILNCGYVAEDYVKTFDEANAFNTIYIMNKKIPENFLKELFNKLLNDNECGEVFRIKGFVKASDNNWLQINATSKEICIDEIALGQEIIIVIGENLNETRINEIIGEYVL